MSLESFSAWANLASVIGLAGTIWSLWLARRSLGDAEKAREEASQAREEAEGLRSLYARKSRLPELQVELDALATELDMCLVEFSEMGMEANERAGRIYVTIQTVGRHLERPEMTEIDDQIRTIERNRGVRTLPQGQAVRTATRAVSLYLAHLIEDERARAL